MLSHLPKIHREVDLVVLLPSRERGTLPPLLRPIHGELWGVCRALVPHITHVTQLALDDLQVSDDVIRLVLVGSRQFAELLRLGQPARRACLHASTKSEVEVLRS